MRKYPKIVQCDSRGQIVIPKDIRKELDIDEGTGFFVYSVTDEGILLKKVDQKPLDEEKEILSELLSKSDKVGVEKENIVKTLGKYKKQKKSRLEDV